MPKSSVYDLLVNEGFVIFPEGEDNLIVADRAFFGGRAIEWIRSRSPDPNFNLQAYLVALTYYKLRMADLKFQEDELLYSYKGVTLEGAENEFSEDDNETARSWYSPSETPPSS